MKTVKAKEKSQKKKNGKGVVKKRSLNNRIRDAEKLLAKPNLKEEIRKAMEEKLAALKEEKEEKDVKEKERAFALRYKKVKFIEKKKVLRRIQKAKSSLEAAEKDGNSELEELQKSVDEETAKLNYITYFPKLEKYIALFPPTPHGDETIEKQKELLALTTERALAAKRARGEAPVEARDSEEEEQNEVGEEEEESDGFFEEGE